MRTGINIWQLKDLFKFANETQAQIDGKFVPARPYGWSNWLTKLKAIKLILTEKADIVIWPGNQ